MPSTVILTDIVKEPNDGRVLVRFSNGTELEFSNMAVLEEDLVEIDSDVDNTQMMALGWIKARQPSLDNINPIKGKNFIYDLSSPNAIKVQ